MDHYEPIETDKNYRVSLWERTSEKTKLHIKAGTHTRASALMDELAYYGDATVRSYNHNPNGSGDWAAELVVTFGIPEGLAITNVLLEMGIKPSSLPNVVDE